MEAITSGSDRKVERRIPTGEGVRVTLTVSSMSGGLMLACIEMVLRKGRGYTRDYQPALGLRKGCRHGADWG